MSRVLKCGIICSLFVMVLLTAVETRIAFSDFIDGMIIPDYDHYVDVYNYLGRYKSAMKSELPSNLEPDGKYPDRIWVMWLQGEENAPQIVKNCLKNIRKYKGNRKIEFLTADTIKNYIQLPRYIEEKYKNKGIMPAIYSDIVRYCLLYKYGGTWVDATVLLTGEIPDKILNEDLFMFSYHKLKTHNGLFLATNWFIHAKPGSVVMKDLINLHLEYWKNENRLLDYYLSFLFLTMAVNNDSEAKKVFEKMPYVPEQFHFFVYLTRGYKKSTYEALKKHSVFPIHKLSYRARLLRNKPLEWWDEESSLLNYLSQPNAELD